MYHFQHWFYNIWGQKIQRYLSFYQLIFCCWLYFITEHNDRNLSLSLIHTHTLRLYSRDTFKQPQPPQRNRGEQKRQDVLCLRAQTVVKNDRDLTLCFKNASSIHFMCTHIHTSNTLYNQYKTVTLKLRYAFAQRGTYTPTLWGTCLCVQTHTHDTTHQHIEAHTRTHIYTSMCISVSLNMYSTQTGTSNYALKHHHLLHVCIYSSYFNELIFWSVYLFSWVYTSSGIQKIQRTALKRPL